MLSSLVEAGDPQLPVILFLHGYPENWAAFREVMIVLKERYHVLAIDLPGKQKLLFDYFYDVLSYDKDGISAEKRREYVKAYANERAMAAGFDWYRAFPKDEKDNAAEGAINIPLLYVRGERDAGKMEDYIKGFLKAGVAQLSSKLIPGSGHFAPDERPQEVGRAIDEFLRRSLATI
jgi:pimeloyl-ACP methyl ester carboxylesterase